MTFKTRYQRYSLIAIVVCVGLIVIVKLGAFLGGLLGAITMYIMLRKSMHYLTGVRRMKSGLAAFILLLGFILCVLVPLSLIIWMLIDRMDDANLNLQTTIGFIKQFANLLEEKTGYNIFDVENLSSSAVMLSKIGQYIMNGIMTFFVNIFVMIFVLYFMLISGKRMEAYIYALLPFSETNKKEVLSEIYLLVRSNAIGIPLQALIQGLIATFGYYIFDVPVPFIFGLLTCFATVIPIVGTAIVWIPLVIYMGLNSGWTTHTAGLFAYAALVLMPVDNLIRFILQKKMADTHPLVTFFGVIIGLSLFGFMGIIFGPLLLSILFLCINIFKKEYLEGYG
ncbi:hypothetical protein EZS27_003654 [termite gut metagenome]|uniref:AI-2 transport protein TqsA n=1 Tax=termite gut metagenome TaxID=433724 RepID=A0A5J4SUH5_9ZZZZ